MMLTAKNILDALARVTLPGHLNDIVAGNMVSGVSVEDGKVGFLITLTAQDKAHQGWLQNAAEDAVKSLPGVRKVNALLTAERAPEPATADIYPRARAVWNTTPLAHVGRIIAVASGKGGVGKSTTAVNLAHAFTRLGKRVGLLDADIYGPSIPRMMGIKDKPEVEGNIIIPLTAHGILCMSMGLLVGEASAMVWRGPQLSKALNQMLRGVRWGTAASPLDTLIIDMPPGTGDIHLSLVQQIPLDGAVIVTTPQEVAVADARKCIDMFAKVNVPILGVIENMSGFTDASGTLHTIFGEGGGRRLAESTHAKFLGQVPIDINLRIASDTGARFEDKTELYKAITELL